MKVIKHHKNKRNGGYYAILKSNEEFYYIDSAYSFDHGYETMIFKCNYHDEYYNINWDELYAKTYRSRMCMLLGHIKILFMSDKQFKKMLDEALEYLDKDNSK